MSVSNNVGFTWSSGSANGLNQSVTLSGNTSIIDSFSATESTTTEFHLAWINANLQSIVIIVDQPTVLKTNSSGSPQDTITLAAGKPFVWYTGSGIANPFDGNVTTTFWTVAGEVASNVQVRVLTNS